jgi:hypothetical protein
MFKITRQLSPSEHNEHHNFADKVGTIPNMPADYLAVYLLRFGDYLHSQAALVSVPLEREAPELAARLKVWLAGVLSS